MIYLTTAYYFVYHLTTTTNKLNDLSYNELSMTILINFFRNLIKPHDLRNT